jgi:hypothetical protein
MARTMYRNLVLMPDGTTQRRVSHRKYGWAVIQHGPLVSWAGGVRKESGPCWYVRSMHPRQDLAQAAAQADPKAMVVTVSVEERQIRTLSDEERAIREVTRESNRCRKAIAVLTSPDSAHRSDGPIFYHAKAAMSAARRAGLLHSIETAEDRFDAERAHARDKAREFGEATVRNIGYAIASRPRSPFATAAVTAEYRRGEDPAMRFAVDQARQAAHHAHRGGVGMEGPKPPEIEVEARLRAASREMFPQGTSAAWPETTDRWVAVATEAATALGWRRVFAVSVEEREGIIAAAQDEALLERRERIDRAHAELEQGREKDPQPGSREHYETQEQRVLQALPNVSIEQLQELSWERLDEFEELAARAQATPKPTPGPRSFEVEIRDRLDPTHAVIRMVDVPADEMAQATSVPATLDLVFRYGQNDFQPKRMPSVSVGDVIRYEGQRWRVEPIGFNREDGGPTTVEFHGQQCQVQRGAYVGGRIALELVHPEEGRVACATVNLPDVPLAGDEALVKDYSENAGMLAALLQAGIVEDTGRRVESGFVCFAIVRVRPERSGTDAGSRTGMDALVSGLRPAAPGRSPRRDTQGRTTCER